MMRALAREERGQMTVELAVMVPVAIVVGLIIWNLLTFVELCAQFDRVSHAAIVTQAVSPAGADPRASSILAVRESIERAMPPGSCEVEVRAEAVSRLGGATTFDIGPALTRVTCTLRYRPRPSAFSIAGVSFSPPFELVHERSLVVDRFRSGVVA